MSKILESLQLTIIAGVVLTIIMAFATDRMSSGPSASDMMNDAKGKMENMMN